MSKIPTIKQALKDEKNIYNKLEDPRLVKLIIDEVLKEGVVGEQDTIMALILKISLRLVKNATPTSSNMLVSDVSGGGKDFITKRVCEVMLESEKTFFHRTDLSPKVLNYWELKDKDGNPRSFDGKVLYLEDPEESVIKSQGFKVRTSGGNAITVLKDQTPVTVVVNGKPVIIVTSMKTSIDIEGTRRWDAVRIDTSKALSKKIKEQSLMKAAGLIEHEKDEQLRTGLKLLKRVEVKIPFAVELVNELPNTTIIRTQILKLIDYIKGSAALHQYQREKDDRGRVIANYDDYEYARFLFIKLNNVRGEALNKQEEEFLYYLDSKQESVKVKTIISETTGISKDWIYRNLDNLIERKLVKIDYKFDADANREVQHLSNVKRNLSKQLPSAKTLFDAEGYISSGQLYKDINKDRKGLKKIGVD